MTILGCILVGQRLKFLQKYCCKLRSMSTDTVRVRFAPSPTGFMHLGSLRTALYNYLFAKKHNGQFILRIEDTDQSRIVESSVHSILDTLEWAGLRFDVGPIYQSSRIELYNEKVSELLQKKAAYRCFCTEHRLDLLRKEAAKNREIVRYDRRCYHLSENEVKEKLEKNTPFTVRFKLENENITFNDLIFGRHTKNVFESESDPILLKSTGFPTYHLANVVDDKDMNITHVFRGSEWLGSTALHILLYRAFGWQCPQFAHLPLITNKDGSKLSKRLDSVRIEFLKESGYLPKAVTNYLRSIGGGFEDLNQDEVYDLDKLSQTFKPELIASKPAKLDVEKLNYYNRKVLKEYKENNLSFLVNLLKYLVTKKYGVEILSQFSDEYLKFVVEWCQGRVCTLNDLLLEYSFIWTEPKLTANIAKFSSLGSLEELIEDICKIIMDNCTDQQLTLKLFKEYCEKNNIKYGKFMQFIRTSLTNATDGPPVLEILMLLGAQKTVKRLRNSGKYIKKLNENIKNKSLSN